MLKINYPFKKEILACAGGKQSGFCLTKNNYAHIVNGLGNLEDESALKLYQQQIEGIKKQLKSQLNIITHDLQPECILTKYAQNITQKQKQKNKDIKCLAVQHHHAHLASCIGENKIEPRSKIIGVVFDEPALGEDGHFWGGEFFVGNLKKFERAAHLKYIPAAKNYLEYWQQAAILLYQALGDSFVDLEIDFLARHKKDDLQIIKQNLSSSLCNSSMSVFFDIVATLIGLGGRVELERIVNRSSHVAGRSYAFTLKSSNNGIIIHHESIILGIVEDLKMSISKSIISAVFHNTIAEIVWQVCRKISRREKVKEIILSGSVFQNKVLFNRLRDLLSRDGLNLITHRHFSCTDDCLSFGQAVLANAQC